MQVTRLTVDELTPHPTAEESGVAAEVIPTAGWRGPQLVPSKPAPITVEQLFDLHAEAIYRFVYRQVGNHHDAEDLTSEVFLKAARSLDPQQPDSAIVKWLFTLARTTLADYWRKWYRLPPVVDIDGFEVAADVDGPTPDEIDQQHIELVDQILSRLPERQAAVLRLRFLKGYTLGETAMELGITLTNAKVIQHRALQSATRMAGESK